MNHPADDQKQHERRGGVEDDKRQTDCCDLILHVVMQESEDVDRKGCDAGGHDQDGGGQLAEGHNECGRPGQRDCRESQPQRECKPAEWPGAIQFRSLNKRRRDGSEGVPDDK